ncbi:DUF2779 domain-containing protein [Candidatus Mycoplasma mahonii]|uniref:DUF2779 domain-containing protein n=1 Tax=Candidatus Mycoplasma mahonii TaxID=3004105 RepID=UPI0026EECF44|nr:DUF2779 domain-containing protein [Candidatus Mycoplasma mahonii]WKX02396.1 DUF2779 domain-containing protein [Candidatus Mycoplasma mahonii]
MSNEYIKYAQFRKYLTAQPFFIWHKLDDAIDVEESATGFSFEDLTDSLDIDPTSQIMARTYSLFDKWLMNKLIKDNEIIILSAKSVEDKIIETKKYLDSGKLILRPVFEHDGAVAQPFAYDTKSKIIVDIKYSKKTKRADFMKAFWNYSITAKYNIVHDYQLFLPVDKDYKKNEIDLIAVNKIHSQKGGFAPGEIDKNGNEKAKLILPVVISRQVDKNTIFPDIDFAIKKIKEAKDTKVFSENLELDTTSFGDNNQWVELLEVLKHPYAGVNGNLIKKKSLANDDTIDSSLWDDIKKAKKASVYNEEIVRKTIDPIIQATHVLWYDFEGYSLPFAPLDNIAPNSQVPFQVSIIETIDNVEVRKENKVVDPRTLTLEDLFDVVKTVYANKVDCYVVYNKTYENTRIKEIVKYMDKADHPQAATARSMYEWIINHTVDLYDIFVISKKDAEPGIILHDQKARSSIKNVEKHITANHIELPRVIVPYKELDVQNGMMAMNLAIERALGIIGENKWKQEVTKLRKYCENDVRAMIMVYDFALLLMD